ncbi:MULTISPECIES: 16S rRNA (uracil(1498)-N(3))-methyltransferase [Cupriavidus]|uniref:Ribosomal RNA small subunit methyltransferase E n=1 Tax=Cupriavidus pinatubonensis (strain JMP 134 / LMG 1197) TaxID=264198 RepID=Q46XC9_CUPPJ|nr:MULTISPECIES: 16S rRNA (uracil(1498)-N(3))-methyltransferase [Cupriavidus]QYY31062.1 16S rRNA (uracil(1498)-N(3))-methyltransferase [Cupriavidus pinatubonensis]TPQ31672.1 16S rRNA (uracil(1498)-N(3))-methyltransferase [Cupriavidus pinatubonensis]
MPPRFFVGSADAALAAGTDFDLPEAVVRHVQVLRLAPGDAITLFDGRGGSHAATLLDLGKRHALARVGERDNTETEPPFRVMLAQGLAGGDKMDWLIEKAVELGVTAIQPLQAARSVVRLSGDRAQKRQAHWQALVEAACEQCGRNRLPAVAPVTNLDTWLRAAGEGNRLLVSPRADQSLPAYAAANRVSLLAGGVTLLIGPEGGLAPEEEDAALHAGFTAVSLGPRILRTETAGLACLATLNALLGGF